MTRQSKKQSAAPGRATLKQVAAAAGVSVGMAGRVLGDYGSFSDKTRKAVIKAARQLDYRPNGVARSLRLRRTRAIGVMISDIGTFHWTVFVQGVEAAARRACYDVILANTADDAALERSYLESLRERGVDGIIVSPLPENSEHFARLAATGFPLVVTGWSSGIEATRIVSDDRSAAAEAVAYLFSLGHRRIGLVAGSLDLESGRNRLCGYREGLEAAGIAFDERLVAYGNYDRDQAYDAARRLVTGTPSPTALLVCNEAMTGSVLQCLKDHGIAVPADLSLIGFDDPAWASFFNPAITTLREERFDMGRLACDSLIAGLANPTSGFGTAPEIRLRTTLVRRESCAPPRRRTRPLVLEASRA